MDSPEGARVLGQVLASRTLRLLPTSCERALSGAQSSPLSLMTVFATGERLGYVR